MAQYEKHYPVMLNEVLQYLQPDNDKIYIDATFGAGGYSRAILQKANCKILAIDRDSNVKPFADQLLLEYPNRFKFEYGNFSDIINIMAKNNVNKVDGLIIDLGVSSMQLDDRERGFSFDSDARLDMRMDRNISLTAFDVVNNFDQEEIANILYDFGEEPKSRLIASRITKYRKNKAIESCKELAKIIHSCYPKRMLRDPATKSFQAIRIFINQELTELNQILASSKKILQKNAPIIAVSFHSLEDKIIKEFFRQESKYYSGVSRYMPLIDEYRYHQQLQHRKGDNLNNSGEMKIITKSPIVANDEEIAINPRSRSAKMRVAIKI